MLLELIVALLLGCTMGTFTGLTPGIHINLVGATIVSISTSLLYKINPIYLVTFITSMAITHTFLDFIPSIFLGCPDTDTELSILPGHQLLKRGNGYQAVLLTTYGSLAAIFILILIAFPSILLVYKTHEYLEKLIPFILIIISLTLIFLEKNKQKATLVFLLTGLLGWSTLNLENLNQPLFPLLTGLFGSSMLILSIKNKQNIPKQKIKKPSTKLIKPLLGAIIAAPICSFLPGMGSGQAAIIGNSFLKKNNKKGFLVLLGATNTLVMGFSFLSLYTISRTRTGATLAIKEILSTNITTPVIILILITTFLTGIISFFITIKLAKIFSNKIHKINYTKFSFFTISILLALVFLISGPLGTLILIISTLTGIYCINLGIRRTNMMGCLLIPTIIFYLT